MSERGVSRMWLGAAGACWLGASLCWGIAFLAGHDVWQAMGRPDFWRGEGVGAFDLRVFAWAFYLMPWLGLAGAVAGWVCLRRRGGLRVAWKGGELR